MVKIASIEPEILDLNELHIVINIELNNGSLNHNFRYGFFECRFLSAFYPFPDKSYAIILFLQNQTLTIDVWFVTILSFIFPLGLQLQQYILICHNFFYTKDHIRIVCCVCIAVIYAWAYSTNI